jgi:Protein kinase domain
MGATMTAAARKIVSEELEASNDELSPGTKLLYGQFTIESFVNSGGFGIVYIARDSLDRKVVIKECFPSAFCRRVGANVGVRSRAQQDEFRAAVKHFMQEAVTLSQLKHPNIVKVHEVFEDNETAYMAMDYIDGPDLLQTVEGSARPLTPKEIIAFLQTMLDAVGHVHDQGLLHRDISPDNILLDTTSGQPILIDFGASRKEVTRKSRALSGLRVVKDGYSPQEFYVQGSKQAPCSDLYALAASFYHLISGETPKTSQERLSSIASREGDPLRPLAGRFKAYPREFLQAIDKAMALFPRDRLQSVAEWRAMLGGAAQPLPAAVAMPVVAAVPVAKAPSLAQALTAAPVAAAAWRGQRDLVVISTAAVLLLAGLLSIPFGLGKGSNATVAVSAPVAAAPAAPAAENQLAVTNMLRLPDGLAFDITESDTGARTALAVVPEGFPTDMQPGDVLLVYQPTGEMLGTATALRSILKREFAKGVTTYSFVIQRGTSTLNAEFRLSPAG